jgi:hypothetical protein
MSVPLFVSERSKPKITTQPLSVGCLIFERMDQIDFTGPFEVLSRMRIQPFGSSAKSLRLFATCRAFGLFRMWALRKREYLMET